MKKVLIGLLFTLLLVPSVGLTQEKGDFGDTLVVIGCKVDDMTGKRDPSRNGIEVRPSRDWKDLEWHKNKWGEMECKREIVNPKAFDKLIEGTKLASPVTPDYSTVGKCARGSMMLAPVWNEKNEGWAVMGIGCPKPMFDKKTKAIVGYILPGCPRELGGVKIKCHFDESEI